MKRLLIPVVIGLVLVAACAPADSGPPLDTRLNLPTGTYIAQWGVRERLVRFDDPERRISCYLYVGNLSCAPWGGD